jgi:tetratricopeptide (TPR) repeat protein
LGSPNEADATALRALAVDPALADAVLVRAWVATGRGDGETAIACYRRMVQLKPDAVRWALKLVQLLNWHGRLEEAVNELRTISQRWPNDPLVRTFLRNYGPAATVAAAPTIPVDGNLDHAEEAELEIVARKAPGPGEYLRPLLEPDPEQDVLIAGSPGAQTAVLVFTGSNDAVSMPITLFDRYLAAIPVTAVYLKDFNRLRYLRGIKSLSKNYEEAIAALAELLGRLGTKRLVTLGNCDGGFAAIRYGVELGAARVVTFGAPTYSPGDALTRIEQARNFMRNRLAASVPADLMDLKPFLETHSHTTHIDLFYEADDVRDSSQSLHLAGLPRVQLHPHPGLSNHRLLRALALENQDFRGLLEELLGAASPVIKH